MRTAHRINARTAFEAKLVQALEVATQILEEKLDLDVCLQVQRQVGWAGHDAWHAGMYCNDGSGSTEESALIKINLRNLAGQSAFTVLKVLGHEIRHAVQYSTGLLSGYGRWTGDAPAKLSAPAYQKRWERWASKPWEQDAMAHEEMYANLVAQDPRFAPFADVLNIEGDVPLKNDVQGTFRALGFTGSDDPLLQIFKARDGKLYWMNLRQVDATAKKWRKPISRLAWSEHRELMMSQPLEYLKTPVTFEDLVC